MPTAGEAIAIVSPRKKTLSGPLLSARDNFSNRVPNSARGTNATTALQGVPLSARPRDSRDNFIINRFRDEQANQQQAREEFQHLIQSPRKFVTKFEKPKPVIFKDTHQEQVHTIVRKEVLQNYLTRATDRADVDDLHFTTIELLRNADYNLGDFSVRKELKSVGKLQNTVHLLKSYEDHKLVKLEEDLLHIESQISRRAIDKPRPQSSDEYKRIATPRYLEPKTPRTLAAEQANHSYTPRTNSQKRQFDHVQPRYLQVASLDLSKTLHSQIQPSSQGNSSLNSSRAFLKKKPSSAPSAAKKPASPAPSTPVKQSSTRPPAAKQTEPVVVRKKELIVPQEDIVAMVQPAKEEESTVVVAEPVAPAAVLLATEVIPEPQQTPSQIIEEQQPAVVTSLEAVKEVTPIPQQQEQVQPAVPVAVEKVAEEIPQPTAQQQVVEQPQQPVKKQSELARRFEIKKPSKSPSAEPSPVQPAPQSTEQSTPQEQPKEAVSTSTAQAELKPSNPAVPEIAAANAALPKSEKRKLKRAAKKAHEEALLHAEEEPRSISESQAPSQQEAKPLEPVKEVHIIHGIELD